MRWHSRDGRWYAMLQNRWLGYFPTKEAAEAAYQAEAARVFGEHKRAQEHEKTGQVYK